jgi:uncharacterized protein (DUF1800 family)
MDSLRGVLAIVLCSNLCLPAPIAAAAPPPMAHSAASRPAYSSPELQPDARILHSLDRFTFGSRPGDVEAVRAMGLETWFERQLHPANIDEADLNARLAQFPAMQWSVQELLLRIPSNAMVRQAMNGRIQVPRQGVLHAVYQDAIYRLQMRQTEKNQKNAASASPAPPGDEAMDAGPRGQNRGAEEDSAKTMDAKFSGMMDANSGAAANAPAPVPDDPQAMALAAQMDALDDDPATDAILTLPPQQRVLKLEAMQPAEFEDFLKSLRPAQRTQLTADMVPALREAVDDLENPQRLVVQELMAERLTRDIYSNAQLQEVMTDFWFNHFNIYLRKNEQMPYYLVSFERDTIRPRALGKFEDLLEAVAHSPAMLLYLDNAESVGPDSLAAERAKMAAWRRPARQRQDPPGINENYARELMELHTLGVNGGYTQADVIQVARVLTGWTVDRPQFGGGFVFNPNRHEPGTKKVLGKKIKGNGEMEGRELLHMLAMRPATAHFLSRELAERLVSDDPPPSLVDRMAKTYLASGGDISAVLRTMFHSPEFWSNDAYRAKVKTPLEFVVSAVRASDANVENFMPLVNALRAMGMPLYECIPPSGYSWDAATWVSTGALVNRMNFALNLTANRLPGITVQWLPQNADATTTESAIPSPQSEEARLEPLLLPGGASASTRAAALDEFDRQIAQRPAATRPILAGGPKSRANPRRDALALEREDQLLAGLLIGSPDFQRR